MAIDGCSTYELSFDYDQATSTDISWTTLSDVFIDLCPSIVYTLKMQDNTVIDNDVFEFDAINGKLSVRQVDYSKIRVYQLRLSAQFDGYSEISS